MTDTRTLEALPYRVKILIMAAATIALFMATLNQTSVATAAQTIVADIGGFELYTWLFAGFSLAAAVALPILGKLSDTFGRRSVLLWALAVFLVASCLCGTASRMTHLISFRVVQGLGSAGVMGSIMIIVADLWSAQERAKWLGFLALGFTLAGLSGPILGGVVSESLGWRWVFLCNLPVGVAAAAGFYFWLPGRSDDEARERRSLDVTGAIWFSASTTALLLLFALVGNPGTSLSKIALLAAAMAGGLLFLRAESRAKDPMIPLHLFRNRTFAFSCIICFTLNSSLLTIVVFGPLFIEGALARAATDSARPLMAMAIGVALGSAVSGQMLARLGHPRELGVFALGTCAAGLYGLSELSVAGGILTMTILSGMVGVGVSFAITVFTVPVQNMMPPEHLGVVTSTLQFARVLGLAVGSAGFGAILQASLATGFASAEVSEPSMSLRDPATLVAEGRLSAVRETYLTDPALGQKAYESDLVQSRENLANGVRSVFVVAAIISTLSIMVAFFTFTPHPKHPRVPRRADGPSPERSRTEQRARQVLAREEQEAEQDSPGT